MKCIRREGEDDAMKKLYEASMEGCVLTFNSLIQKDPLILSKISLTTFSETPLHISALLGHLNFTKQLVTHKPKLASTLDSLKRSPLHLASAEGHSEIVQVLLQENEEMCLVKDDDGRVPVHYAAMRGHVDVIKLFFHAEPGKSSIFAVLPDGETVLHLCVQYNQLEALKVLVELARYENTEFLNSKEHVGGNSILHLAVTLKQIEVIKYLLSVSEVRERAGNTLNRRGLKASNLIDHCPTDFKSLKILQIFRDYLDVGLSQEHQLDDQYSTFTASTSTTGLIQNQTRRSPVSWWVRWWRKFVKFSERQRDGFEDKRDMLMTVATLIATATFQTALSPPGGVWQENISSGSYDCSKTNMCYAGTSVLARAKPYYYLHFLLEMSFSFLASLGTIILLMSGLPLNNKIISWILRMTVFSALLQMADAFVSGIVMVTPDSIIDDFDGIFLPFGRLWAKLIFLAMAFQTIGFLIWIIKKLFRFCFKPKMKPPGSDQT
ncbi:hypothetical protein UlMin_042542 [Ulmus minor]